MWQGVYAKDCAGNNSQCSKRASRQLGKIISSNVLHNLATAAGQRSVGEGESDANNKVAQSTEA